MLKTIICKTCKASFVQETKDQRICNDCLPSDTDTPKTLQEAPQSHINTKSYSTIG